MSIPDRPDPRPSPVGERELSRVAATSRGVHDRLVALDPDRRNSYTARRTLRLRVEIVRQVKRRRTQVAFGLLAALPVIIAIAFEIGGGAGSNAPQLVGLATAGGFNFALFTEFASVGFLLVVVIALFCGDTVASEAGWSSLRYLLAQPVPRTRLLRQKLAVALLQCLVANVFLPVWAFVVGGLFFGWGPTRSPLGTTFDAATSLGKFAVIVVFVSGQLLIVAALAFLLSTMVDNPLGAVGGAVMLVVVSSILDQITALHSLRDYLPTHYQFAWIDALGSPIDWGDMTRGSGSALVYAAVFLAWAWLRFDRKDITS